MVLIPEPYGVALEHPPVPLDARLGTIALFAAGAVQSDVSKLMQDTAGGRPLAPPSTCLSTDPHTQLIAMDRIPTSLSGTHAFATLLKP